VARDGTPSAGMQVSRVHRCPHVARTFAAAVPHRPPMTEPVSACHSEACVVSNCLVCRHGRQGLGLSIGAKSKAACDQKSGTRQDRRHLIHGQPLPNPRGDAGDLGSIEFGVRFCYHH